MLPLPPGATATFGVKLLQSGGHADAAPSADGADAPLLLAAHFAVLALPASQVGRFFIISEPADGDRRGARPDRSAASEWSR